MNIAKMSSVNFGSQYHHRPGNTTQPGAGNNAPKTPEASYWYQKGFAKAMMIIAMAAPLAAAETSCSGSSEVDPIVKPVETQVTQTNQDCMDIVTALGLPMTTDSKSPTYCDHISYRLGSTNPTNNDAQNIEFKNPVVEDSKTTYDFYESGELGDGASETTYKVGKVVFQHEYDGLHVKFYSDEDGNKTVTMEDIFKISDGKVYEYLGDNETALLQNSGGNIISKLTGSRSGDEGLEYSKISISAK